MIMLFDPHSTKGLFHVHRKRRANSAGRIKRVAPDKMAPWQSEAGRAGLVDSAALMRPALSVTRQKHIYTSDIFFFRELFRFLSSSRLL